MVLNDFFVRALIWINILIAIIPFFSLSSNAQALKKEENKSWSKKIVDILVPPSIPPTQGDNYCFVMPREGHNSTNTGKPRFIWDGIATKIQIFQEESLIWERTIESEGMQNAVYDGETSLEKGYYEYIVITNERPHRFGFYINSTSEDLQMSELTDIDPSIIHELVASGNYWDANQIAYSINNPDLIDELKLRWSEHCQQERED